MATLTLTAALTPEEGGYVARCAELPVTTESDTFEGVVAALREAVDLYLDDGPVVTSFEITVSAA